MYTFNTKSTNSLLIERYTFTVGSCSTKAIPFLSEEFRNRLFVEMNNISIKFSIVKRTTTYNNCHVQLLNDNVRYFRNNTTSKILVFLES